MPAKNDFQFTRVLLYARDMEKTAAFYAENFGYSLSRDPDGRIFELTREGSFTIMVHQAAKSQNRGQSCVKLVIDVGDVEGFKAASPGLKLGSIHRADGYCFANCRDPDGNPISVSSRAFRESASQR